MNSEESDVVGEVTKMDSEESDVVGEGTEMDFCVSDCDCGVTEVHFQEVIYYCVGNIRFKRIYFGYVGK
jgi:hypothetical protein